MSTTILQLLLSDVPLTIARGVDLSDQLRCRSHSHRSAGLNHLFGQKEFLTVCIIIQTLMRYCETLVENEFNRYLTVDCQICTELGSTRRVLVRLKEIFTSY